MELLGYHILNLGGLLYQLGKARNKICGGKVYLLIQDMKPSSDELTCEKEQVKVDIVDKIRRELTRFPRLDFLKYAFNDYFNKIEDTISETTNDYDFRVTIGSYMEKLSLLKCKRDGENEESFEDKRVSNFLIEWFCSPCCHFGIDSDIDNSE